MLSIPILRGSWFRSKLLTETSVTSRALDGVMVDSYHKPADRPLLGYRSNCNRPVMRLAQSCPRPLCARESPQVVLQPYDIHRPLLAEPGRYGDRSARPS